jgi:D-3-phosphoglycerate dehydrogenase
LKKRVLFLDEVHHSLEDALTEHGFFCEKDYNSVYSEILEKIDQYFGLVIRSRIPIDKELLEKAKNLRFVARSGSGLENIDLKTAEDRGIKVFSSPEGNKDAVGEHAVGMLLMLFNKLNTADAQVRKGIWLREENRGLELGARTVGIIGFGNTGSAFAQKLSGFGCSILAYDKYKENYAPDYVTETSLEDLKQKADIVSIHLPLSEETNYYIDRAFIDSVSSPFYLVNTARGKQVNTEHLVEGLEKGKILGACLDVLEYEKKSLQGLENDSLPEAYSKLLQFPNVVLSPHVAGWTVESYKKLSSVLAEKIMNQSFIQ